MITWLLFALRSVLLPTGLEENSLGLPLFWPNIGDQGDFRCDPCGGSHRMAYVSPNWFQSCLTLVWAAQQLPKLQPEREAPSAPAQTCLRKCSGFEGLDPDEEIEQEKQEEKETYAKGRGHCRHDWGHGRRYSQTEKEQCPWMIHNEARSPLRSRHSMGHPRQIGDWSWAWGTGRKIASLIFLFNCFSSFLNAWIPN